MQQTHQNLCERVVLLYDITSQKMRMPFTRDKVIINRPILGASFLCINPVLPNPRGKNRMFHIQEKYAARLQSSTYFLKNPTDVLNIMQGQIGNNTVPLISRIFVFFYSADPVFNITVLVSPLGFLYHFPAQINPQNPHRPAFCGKLTVPAVSTSQVQNMFSLQRRE